MQLITLWRAYIEVPQLDLLINLIFFLNLFQSEHLIHVSASISILNDLIMLILYLVLPLPLLVSDAPYFLIECLNLLFNYSDVFTFCLLLLRSIQNCFLPTMYLFQLHVFIKKLLKFTVLLFGHVF